MWGLDIVGKMNPTFQEHFSGTFSGLSLLLLYLDCLFLYKIFLYQILGYPKALPGLLRT
uniref:Uncharacterized protein n=1 Tax=Picea glauca TaxID=3330 RepID=A0A101LTZ2_PICGL|nr:hypothetical protein ABT39_MTgene3405 [Picea glauca]